MIDREKVISALEKRYDPEREYLHLVFIPNGLVRDALALLKEDDKKIKRLIEDAILGDALEEQKND